MLSADPWLGRVALVESRKWFTSLKRETNYSSTLDPLHRAWNGQRLPDLTHTSYLATYAPHLA